MERMLDISVCTRSSWAAHSLNHVIMVLSSESSSLASFSFPATSLLSSALPHSKELGIESSQKLCKTLPFPRYLLRFWRLSCATCGAKPKYQVQSSACTFMYLTDSYATDRPSPPKIPPQCPFFQYPQTPSPPLLEMGIKPRSQSEGGLYRHDSSKGTPAYVVQLASLRTIRTS